MPRHSTRKALLSDLQALYVFYLSSGDDDTVERILAAYLPVDTSRYLTSRIGSSHADSSLAALTALSDKDFRQLTRISKRSFCALHNYIHDNPVFQSTSPNGHHKQQPVSWQLAMALARLSENENDASVGHLHRHFVISVESVVKYTKRVLTALKTLCSQWLEWPSPVPAYKRPLADNYDNTEFNFYLAKSRLSNEHTIGILKSRWASLREMRNQLRSKAEMDFFIEWVLGCCTLHNMLAKLGDAWKCMASDDDEDDGIIDSIEGDTERSIREKVKSITLQMHRFATYEYM
ncbi:hypothetical protein F442_19238 [Phytophthora nicotianae P10297]|uniref:DDE Tnp4 domain-containing protein n=1 Tax=Phytophthora nicotianae P10297 TaxID=1317064 RepID=W2YAD0_PHYNI|nr:hypothetical protein F442_19238 [Phytophthora nicotianae P10297]